MRIESSSWVYLDVQAIANYDDSIKISDRRIVDTEDCFISNIKAMVTSDSAEELYEQLKHYYGDCDDEECKYCETCGDDCMEDEDY